MCGKLKKQTRNQGKNLLKILRQRERGPGGFFLNNKAYLVTKNKGKQTLASDISIFNINCREIRGLKINASNYGLLFGSVENRIYTKI
ncbi:hypothetical protein BpHYR1_046552 [Brachionus plicatilis]|uniref:Uncharacterized protein n=1 Tax=Brachionus plicatilis TaxID=10195 RepID=A0A3M7RS26_BRAPC|nr:hypothetical protein BpHYR1_046552 [Brachionus plicatilis]